ncbi:hypothetical protein F5J12DRAFT_701455, partial [Pisolithus orientalis]|uniref:uncharacterized protein n=1 Tax=Pisolithus orientalis TaxID=936130 RepID=UPI0022248302
RYMQNSFGSVMAKNIKLTVVEGRNQFLQFLPPCTDLCLQANQLILVSSRSLQAIYLPGMYVNQSTRTTDPKRIENVTLAYN